MRETISVRLSNDTKRELDDLARRDGVSRSRVVQAALRRHLSLRRSRRVRDELTAGM